GTPIENKLIDLFSIVSVLDPHFFGPLWEFSWKHCLFDPEKINKINGYYNLQQLNEKVRPILLRREKQKVLSQLPNVRHIDIPVNMHPEQENYHASYAKGVAQIIRKKFLTPFDLQKLQLLLTSMRMVCDSTFLIDKETNHSPKLQELEYILLDKLDLKNNNRKVIIFSEWILMHKLFGEMLRKNNIGFVELNGKVPVKTRGELIRKFEKDDDCRIFLSTEAGGAGLNLQAADTVINFELPWNPAKKNQRIGRIDRLGQKNKHLTVINLITKNSIETRIASGLLVKQNLFDSVLNSGAKTDFVDFSEKGRSQFLKDLENMIAEQEKIPASFDYDEGVQTEEVEGNESQTELFSENDADEDKITPLSTADLEDPIKQEEVKIQQESNAVKFAQMEEVMNKGMGFLSGLYKMSTGKDLGTENQKIEIDHKTGEVTMKFKLPGFSQ
ncbi:MAG: DEAD/DEAH box helicase, partial [Bacteroidota bacterium]|nr:DEAD/DEAH box helicase [Bacteroidota bacterium]